MSSSHVTYEPLECIGAGGMATVYRARQLGLGGFERIVALKRISAERSADPSFVEWFIREARIASAFAHPGIVQVYDFGRDREGYFIAMEYLEGRTLEQLLASNRTVPIDVACAIARELCDALDHVHRRVGHDGRTLDIVHRDISLANLFLTTSGHLKLIDFGIASARDARWARTSLVGKLAYMAPEAILGDTIDAQTDLFAVGIVLWQLLCGRTLFLGRDDAATLDNVLHAAVPRVRTHRLDCPRELDDLVMRALERDPKRRMASAAAIREYLDTTMRAWLVDAAPRTLARWLAEPVRAVVPEPTLSPTPSPIAVSPIATAPRRSRVARVLPVDATRARGRSLAIRIAVAATLTAAGLTAFHQGRAHDAVAAIAPAAIATPVRPSHASATVAPAPAPEPRVEPPPRATRSAPRPRHRQIPPLPLPIDRSPRPASAPAVATIVEELQLPPPVVIPELAIPELAIPTQNQRSGPITIPPDRLSQLSGELGRVNLRRVELEGVARQIPTVLCVDANGAVASVRFLGRVPGWLQRELEPGLRTFRFAQYVADGTPTAACFTRRVTITR